MRWVVAIIIISFLTFGIIFFQQNQSPATKPNNKPPTPTTQAYEITEARAAFAIFTNGTYRVFTAAMYHNLSEDVFIQADNPNIIHVKRSNTTWNDFFKTLPFSLTKECLTTGTGQTFCTNSALVLKFYLNSRLDPNALDKIINHADQLLVSYGSESVPEIEKQLRQIPILK